MTGRCFLGIDAGTQSVKAGVWDLEGAVLSRASSPLRLSSPREGWAEQDVEEWWRSTCAAVRSACASIEGRIEAVGVAWQRESFTLTDSAMRPLRPAMLWLDIRASEEAEALRSEGARILALTGKPLDVTSSIPRLRWLRRHEPELFRASPRWVDAGCYLLGRLAGSAVSCVAGADTAGMIELGSRDWSAELLELAGLRRRDVPPLVEPGSVVGSVTPEASRLTGLEAGLPVVAAGGDGQVFVTGALGLPGESSGLSLTLGTSVVLGVPVTAARPLPCYRLLVPAAPAGGYLLEAVIQSGTYLFRWLEEKLSPGPQRGMAEREAEARGIPVGSSGLVTVPHWWGTRFPRPLPEARGVTLGWSDLHTGAHLHRSLLEAIAFELRYSLEEIERGGDVRSAPRITVGGGGARSALWLSIIRDVLGLELRVSEEPEPVALGAAMLAAAAGGAVSLPEAARRFVKAGPLSGVDPSAHASYDALYREVYVGLRRETLELSAALSRLSRAQRGG